MSLPTSANRVIAAAQRVSRADLLSLQDAQVAGYARGMRRVLNAPRIPAIAARPLVAGQWPLVVPGYYRQAAAGGHVLYFPLSLPVGRRMVQVAGLVRGGGAGAIVIDVWGSEFLNPAPVHVTGSTVSEASAGAWATIPSLTAPISYTVRSGWRYWIEVVSGNAGDRILWTRLESDRP